MDIENYMEKAELTARVVDAVLTARPGTDPAMIDRWILTRDETTGHVWLFAVLADRSLPRFEPYAAAVHHLSSSLRGMPVIIGNHTGLRYGILLSSKPQLPKSADFPGWRRGVMQLGVDGQGQGVQMRYDEISHTLVAGITQFGKSNLLRLMAIQAREEGWKLALADPDGRTFAKFEHDEALMFPVAKTLDGCNQLIGQVQELINLRAKLYDQAGNSPDGLDEYNEWARKEGRPELAPVLVMLDEFNGTVLGTGGARGAFAAAATQVAWRAAKFGIRLMLAGQDFSKDIVGPVREQMTTRICLRVANERISTVVLGHAGAERLTMPGRALTNRWGAIQTYLVGKDDLARKDENGLSEDEQKLAAYILERGGRMTMDVLGTYGMGDKTARRTRADWQKRGLAQIVPEKDNALCLTIGQAGLSGSVRVRPGLSGQAGLSDFGAMEA